MPEPMPTPADATIKARVEVFRQPDGSWGATITAPNVTALEIFRTATTVVGAFVCAMKELAGNKLTSREIAEELIEMYLANEDDDEYRQRITKLPRTGR